MYVYGSDGACLPFANILFAHYRPPQPPVGGIHAAYSFGGGFGSSPVELFNHRLLIIKNKNALNIFIYGSDGA
jgi:hypothetical protein